MGKLAITGTAQFDVEPDTAIVAIRIEQYEYDYARCADQLNARTLAARQVLETLEVDAETIRTNDYRVEKTSDYFRKEHPNKQFLGAHALRMTLPLERERVNRLLAHLTASDAMLDVSLGYEVRDMAGYRDQAEAMAVRDALRRGALIAEAAGCRVVGISHIYTGKMARESHSTDGWDINEPMLCSGPCDEPDSPEVSPRMLSISAQISLSLEIAGLS
jgi:uncharacterized protein YggE